MRQINQAGLELIKRFESFRAEPYYCPAGVLSVGFGHAIQDGENFSAPITEEQAHALLMRDLMRYERAVEKAVSITLSDDQFSALVSFCYNVGVANFQQSTLLRLVNAGRFDAAATEFRRWIHVGKKPLRGLDHRRIAERDLFLSAH